MRFMVEVRDYEAGREDRTLDAPRLERLVQRLLDRDGSEGIVFVTVEPEQRWDTEPEQRA